ncbi:MAG: hypothetical protein ACREU2_04350 [Steroidobacteraceae bacterium]
MSTYHFKHNAAFFSKRLMVLFAVVAFHVLIAGLFISALRTPGAAKHAQSIIPIPVVPSGRGQPVPI